MLASLYPIVLAGISIPIEAARRSILENNTSVLERN